MTIVSHRHRFIFVRTRKTASTSLEIELSRHVGSDDVVTSFCARDEELRRRAGGHGPQNHLEPGGEYNLPIPTPPGPCRGVRFYNHMPAARIRILVGPQIWDEYFTFCFERNPWDKVVSLYFHRYRSQPRPPLRDFVVDGEARDAFNFPLYHNGERQLVDLVARYEDMTTEVAFLFQRIGLPRPGRLPSAKSQFRTGDSSSLMDPSTAALVAIEFREEIDFAGYSPPAWLDPAF